MNGKIVNYRIVDRGSYPALGDEVRGYVRLGWEPVGGICYTPNGTVLQAMVLRESPPVAPAVKEKKKA